MSNELTWASLFVLVTAASGCSGPLTLGGCDTDELPESDPCYMKSCCESVTTDRTDAGEALDAENVVYRLCGACNG